MKTQTISKTRTGTMYGAGVDARAAHSLVLLTAIALAGGCGYQTSSSSPSSASGPRHLYVGLDTSGSYRPYLGAAATLCARQALRLNPDADTLSLYRLDRSTEEFSNGPAPESGDRLQRVIVTEVQAVPEAGGTYPARFWEAVSGRVADDRGAVEVAVFTDGDNDDETPASAEEIRRAASALAGDAGVTSVCVFGAAPRNWATLRAEFAPLGGRFHLISPPEMTADRVAGALDGGG